jgi:hypothetical protein
LEALVQRDPHKHSHGASFDFEGLQVVENRLGGQIKHLPKQIYAPNAFAAILVCRHTQNFAQNSLLEALVLRDPHKYSHDASFDFEGLQVEEGHPGGQTNRLPKHNYAPNAFVALSLPRRSPNSTQKLLGVLVRRDPHKSSHGASFDIEGLQVEAKHVLAGDNNPLPPHLSRWDEQARQIPDEDMNPLLPHSSG